jgi:hypothetical protein
MRSLKDAGMAEVAALRRRTRRLLAMERVFPVDAEFIIDHLDQIEARIVSMQEFNEYGKEEE